MSAPSSSPTQTLRLPPLILHPFAEPGGPAKLMDGSRASLMLKGVLPAEALAAEQLERVLLEGRYCELSMLFYVGKDLLRWAGQCLDFIQRDPTLGQHGIRPESFLALLVEDPPAQVDQKLRLWGVHEYRRIFARAVGLHAVFEELPPYELLSNDFVRNYHRFADQLFTCRQQLVPFTAVSSAHFDFDLYASGEYTRILEKQWEQS